MSIQPSAYHWPWHINNFPVSHRGDNCCFCGRDIAVPREDTRPNPACIYCGMARGHPELGIESSEWEIPLKSYEAETVQ